MPKPKKPPELNPVTGLDKNLPDDPPQAVKPLYILREKDEIMKDVKESLNLPASQTVTLVEVLTDIRDLLKIMCDKWPEKSDWHK